MYIYIYIIVCIDHKPCSWDNMYLEPTTNCG